MSIQKAILTDDENDTNDNNSKNNEIIIQSPQDNDNVPQLVSDAFIDENNNNINRDIPKNINENNSNENTKKNINKKNVTFNDAVEVKVVERYIKELNTIQKKPGLKKSDLISALHIIRVAIIRKTFTTKNELEMVVKFHNRLNTIIQNLT
tara:strand:- start:606 stop:1058 length:453 start_codon:yes stop_codon:yes gene_type:complete